MLYTDTVRRDMRSLCKVEKKRVQSGVRDMYFWAEMLENLEFFGLRRYTGIHLNTLEKYHQIWSHFAIFTNFWFKFGVYPTVRECIPTTR